MEDLEQARPGKQQNKPSQSGDTVETHAQGASIVQIETVGKSLMILVIAILSIALIAAIAALVLAVGANSEADRAYDKADMAERESRLAQYELTLIRPALRELGIGTEDPETHEE